MALAPSRLFSGVPSRVTRARSMARWSSASISSISGPISSSTFRTARRTPLPPNRDESPSRSSSTSCAPVEAPDGTAARPTLLSARRTSTSTVGLPRESRISRARTASISLIGSPIVWPNVDSRLDFTLAFGEDRLDPREGEMLKDFKQFLLRGNVVDLAVGVVIGIAFGAVITALVDDLITPLIAAIFGKRDFSALIFTVNGSVFRYGAFINAVITFVLVAAAVFFFVVRPVNALMARRRTEPP